MRISDWSSDVCSSDLFVCMRYWHPMSEGVARAVRAFAPDLVVLLPLYPQFSTTTTASSLRVWRQAAAAAGLTAPTRVLCCYPVEPGFVAAGLGRTLGRVRSGQTV